MRCPWSAKLPILLVIAGCMAATAAGQDVLGRLESDIRQGSGRPEPAAMAPQRVVLGVIGLNEAGHGVRIASLQDGGPAQRAGLQSKDLIVGAADKPVTSLPDLTAVLRDKRPGDRLLLEVARGETRFRVEVTLAGTGTGVSPAKPAPPPLRTGPGAGTTGSIPPPPSDSVPPPPTDSVPPPPTDLGAARPAEGPALIVPQPVVPNGPQAQIEELRQRVDQLEKRVQQLERDLAEARKK